VSIAISDLRRLRQPIEPRCRRSIVVAVVVAAAALAGSVAHAQPDEGAAKEAAREIAVAQDRADQAAAAWSQAEAQLEGLEEQARTLEQERAALADQVSSLRADVEKAAAERFMTASGSGGIPILTGYQAPLDQLSAAELGRVVSGTTDDAFDRFDLAQRDLQRKADELAAKQAEVKAQRETFEHAAATAAAEVEHLKQVEDRRLADERVRLALEAQRREEQRRLAEQQAAEAAQRAAAEAQRAAEQQRAADIQQSEQVRAAAASAQAVAGPAAAAVGQPPAAIGDSSTHRDLAVEPLIEAPANPGMICPVQGPTAYSDTWGAPRPGGRRHEGVDMISPKGTPLVAVADGDARFWTNDQGALGVSLTADNGTRYYYGHLSAYEGSSGHVSVGAVIGYVGSTGDTTVNHLHFEVHPGGGAAVNPTPYVRNAGC
jgi:peptidoglycan LD-endopeptidase LytH